MTIAPTFAPRVLLAYDWYVRYTLGLAEGIAANGWDAVLLDRDHDHAFGGDAGAMRRYVDERMGPGVRTIRLEGRVRDPRALRSATAAWRSVQRAQPTVTHVQMCLAHDVRLIFAAHLRRGRYALTVHDVDVHPGDAAISRHQRFGETALLRDAGLVFVHAEQMRETLLERESTRAPVVVVPHGVDAGAVEPLPSEPSLLFFGRLSEYKGLAVLLDAMFPLWERRADATLTIAGEGGMADHPALADSRVRVIHRHILDEEVAGLYGAASIVVLPYIEASQSGVGSLAKGFGRAMVASDVGGLRELVADGSGALVPPRDPAALARQLDKLLGDRAALEQLGRAGLRTMQESAGWPAVGKRTVAAYERYLIRDRGLSTAPLA